MPDKEKPASEHIKDVMLGLVADCGRQTNSDTKYTLARAAHLLSDVYMVFKNHEDEENEH